MCMDEQMDAEEMEEYADYLRDIERDAKMEVDENKLKCMGDIADKVNKMINIRNISSVVQDASWEDIPNINGVVDVFEDDRNKFYMGYSWDSTFLCTLVGSEDARFVNVTFNIKAHDDGKYFEIGFGIILDAAGEGVVLKDGEQHPGFDMMFWQDRYWEFDYSDEVYRLYEPKGEN